MNGNRNGEKKRNGMKYKKIPVPEIEHLPQNCLDIFNLPLFGDLILKWFLCLSRRRKGD
jgi:hypothetical protein